jgi:hypothetical protein
MACVVGVVGLGDRLAAQRSDSLPDTEANRTLQARRYLEAVPVQALFDDLAKNMSANMPEAQASEFKKLFAEIDVEAVEEVLLESLTKHFMAAELRALAEFYDSPVGQSAMAKFGTYMALVHGSGSWRIIVAMPGSGAATDEVSETEPVQVRESTIPDSQLA